MSAKIAIALLAAQKELKAITKDATNPHFKNKYASLDAIIDAVRPVLNKHGLAVTQGTKTPDRDEAGRVTAFTVVTTLLHESGESLSSDVVVPLAKSDAQGAGGALTYGRRYGLSALLCLATDEDDDAERSGRDETPIGNRYPTATPKSPEDRVMPFGKTKGKRLGDHSDEQLASTINWCREKDEAKFADLIASCENILEARREKVPA